MKVIRRGGNCRIIEKHRNREDSPMARAFTGNATERRFAFFPARKPSSAKSRAETSLSGHIRLLARPAYARLVSTEPLLRRAIPILCLFFIATLACYRGIELSNNYTEVDARAHDDLTMIATTLAARLTAEEASLPETGYATALRSALAEAMPPRATSFNRQILLTDAEGTVVASAPANAALEGSPCRRFSAPTSRSPSSARAPASWKSTSPPAPRPLPPCITLAAASAWSPSSSPRTMSSPTGVPTCTAT
ncbi:hypothetical protein [Breoghania sp. L-A4]|uniref:hypothetical protein n=1 Tax=Breoghania sp. L-A4 TaxID=2304600 RepID=UPI003204EE00